MFNPIARYTHWLHTRWPAGTVEKLPVAGEDGTTAFPGVRIVGDLTGIPLLKFSSDTGARAVRAILAEPDFGTERGDDDDASTSRSSAAGVAGVSAAIEAKKAGLNFVSSRRRRSFRRREFPEGQADLHLPDRDEARRRPAVPDGEGSAPRGNGSAAPRGRGRSHSRANRASRARRARIAPAPRRTENDHARAG